MCSHVLWKFQNIVVYTRVSFMKKLQELLENDYIYVRILNHQIM